MQVSREEEPSSQARARGSARDRGGARGHGARGSCFVARGAEKLEEVAAAHPTRWAARRTPSRPTWATRARRTPSPQPPPRTVGPIDLLGAQREHARARRRCRLLLDTAVARTLGGRARGEPRRALPARARSIVGSMALRGRGRVVHVTSDASARGLPDLGRVRRLEGRARPPGRVGGRARRRPEVRFVTLDPGEMDTQMHADAIPDADRARLASPADVARRMAAFLLTGGFPERRADREPRQGGAPVNAATWPREELLP